MILPLAAFVSRVVHGWRRGGSRCRGVYQCLASRTSRGRCMGCATVGCCCCCQCCLMLRLLLLLLLRVPRPRRHAGAPPAVCQTPDANQVYGHPGSGSGTGALSGARGGGGPGCCTTAGSTASGSSPVHPVRRRDGGKAGRWGWGWRCVCGGVCVGGGGRRRAYAPNGPVGIVHCAATACVVPRPRPYGLHTFCSPTATRLRFV
jgi:hypothetical protein